MIGRTFNGTTDSATLAATGWNGLTGAYTIAAVVYRAVATPAASQVIVMGSNAAFNASDMALTFDTDNKVTWFQGPTYAGQKGTATFGVGLFLVAIRKATGTVAPVLDVFSYDTGVWVHDTAGSTIANMGGASTSMAYGANITNASSFLSGDLIAGAAWPSDIGVSGLEMLPFALGNWQLTPGIRFFHLFNQVDVNAGIIDLATVGAAQTSISGTTIGTHDGPVTWGRRRSGLLVAA